MRLSILNFLPASPSPMPGPDKNGKAVCYRIPCPQHLNTSTLGVEYALLMGTDLEEPFLPRITVSIFTGCSLCPFPSWSHDNTKSLDKEELWMQKRHGKCKELWEYWFHRLYPLESPLVSLWETLAACLCAQGHLYIAVSWNNTLKKGVTLRRWYC